MGNKTRLDVLLVERGFAPTRQKAQAIIMAGSVFVAGQRVDKPGTAVANEAELEVRGHTLRYVSRGGLKLEKAMQTFPITLEGKTCADIGASTGGFTDCMLQNGARQRLRRRRRLWPARLEAPQRRARRLSWSGRTSRYLTHGADPGAAGLRVDRRVVHLAEAHLPGALSAAARGGRDRLPD